jgi:hypothetical protein
MQQDQFLAGRSLSLEDDTLRKSSLDLIVLKHMARRLQSALQQTALSTTQHPFHLHLTERHQRTHRLVLYNYQLLARKCPLHFVGFVSRKKPEMDTLITNEMNRVDTCLLQELENQPGVVSYSSLDLRNGDWCNLVLLQDIQAKAHIKGSSTHAYAVSHIAASHYSWIRLHNGMFPLGLDYTKMHLQKTKLYSFVGYRTQPIVHEFVYNQDRKSDCLVDRYGSEPLPASVLREQHLV